MDSERIEEILNEHFPDGQPDGMRERVLSRAIGELRPAKPRWQPVLKLVLAGGLALFILFANVSDRARCTRLAGSYSHFKQPPTYVAKTAYNLGKLTQEAMAWTSDGTDLRKVKDRL